MHQYPAFTKSAGNMEVTLISFKALLSIQIDSLSEYRCREPGMGATVVLLLNNPLPALF